MYIISFFKSATYLRPTWLKENIVKTTTIAYLIIKTNKFEREYHTFLGTLKRINTDLNIFHFIVIRNKSMENHE